MKCLVNYFSNIPLKKLLFSNFIFGLLTGFPFMIGTMLMCFSKSIYGILIIILSILVIIGLNILLNKKNKINANDKNIYSKLIYTFLFLGLGMICISQIAFLFVNFKI